MKNHPEKQNTTSKILTFIFACLCVFSAFGKTEIQPHHPRLLFTTTEEKAVKKLIKKDPLARQLAAFLKTKADSIAEAPQIPYKMDKYGNMLWTSRAYVLRLGTLSLAYRLYGEQKYLDAANKTLLWVCGYKDWDPKHYLDTAEMTTAVAIAYDWLFDALPETTRKIIKGSIYKNAISNVLREYEKGGPGSWAKRETNWNVVCNTGMTLGALAVAEDYPEEAETILKNAAHYMPNCLKHFAPDGVCYEGPAYWGYTNSYLSLYLKAVNDNGGDQGGIGQLPGVSRTALFYKRTLTPSGQRFNFGNASAEEVLNTPAFFFFSKHYGQPEIAEWFRKEIEKTIRQNQPMHQLFFLSLPWFNPASPAQNEQIPALEVYHNSINDLLVLNVDRKEKGSVFLVAKGGLPNQAHQQMDCGTFIIESDSVCWTEDLGADDYALPGFWDGKPGGDRWKYFRNNNFSHNTLNIDRQPQYANGKAFVCEENTHTAQPYARLDLSEVYKVQACKAFRKFTLVNDHTIEVEDEVEVRNTSSTVFWTAATKAEVTINGSVAQLQKDEKVFYFRILSPEGTTFHTYPAYNTYLGEKPIKGITMLEIACPAQGGKAKITVEMSSKK
ncbi:heparinase II/III family protein [Phocaeicola plebeius]|uniref:heparinase II/III domain-containing protein n=1 Tax=Phocaeicola plebeius TaxID=310297 RepID=UPI002012A5D7|nr:heparinase II/III family protein [Phocaeicola plebeius]MCL1613059.1 heparinase II/III-family protein [Phocaeicola plebeius]